MDMGEKEALNLCGQLLDGRHYDLLVDKTGMVVTPTGEVLCILLKQRLSPELLEVVRPIILKAASQRKVAGGNRGVAAGTGMVQRSVTAGLEVSISAPSGHFPNRVHQARLSSLHTPVQTVFAGRLQ